MGAQRQVISLSSLQRTVQAVGCDAKVYSVSIKRSFNVGEILGVKRRRNDDISGTD